MLSPLASIMGPFLYLVGGMLQLYMTPLEAFYMCLVGISLFPMVNALLTITFVAPYRRFTAHWIKAVLTADLRAAVEQSSTVTPASNEVARLRNALPKSNVPAADSRRINVVCTRGNRFTLHHK